MAKLSTPALGSPMMVKFDAALSGTVSMSSGVSVAAVAASCP